MPAMHALMRKAFKSVRGASSYASRDQYGSDGLRKGSYLRQNSDRHHKSGSLPFGVISKSTDVDIYHTKRSDSDIELVNGPPSV